MMKYLGEFADEKNGSLAIQSGRGGSFLTHDHATQFRFVLQSLTLWRQIQREMFRLWIAADSDLLNSDSSYRLVNTGLL